MSTIKDIAKVANVSISTVSYALNNTGSISEETRNKILKIAKELEYTPNGMARGLKMKKNNIIAVVVSSFGGPIFSEIIRGITDIAKNNNYEVIVVESFHKQSTLTKVLVERLVDGAIILDSHVNNDTIISLSNEDFPVVTLDRKISGKYIKSIIIDNINASYEATKYLYKLGYKKIGFMSGPNDTYDSNKRKEGFKKAIKEFEIESLKEWNLTGDFTEESGYNSMYKFLKTYNNIPKAFFCANDEMAIGAIKAFKEFNIKIPKDIAIIGFDDIELCEYITPNLTTVRRPSYELGVVAANSLISSLKGEKTSKSVILTCELIIRNSTQ